MTTQSLPPPRYGKVVLCSGHMIDAKGRKPPRFPESKVPAVEALIAEQLKKWQFGPGHLAICGGACGADLIFAGVCRGRGMRVRLMIALPQQEFVEQSVRRHDNERNWEQQFYDLVGDTVHCEALIQGDYPRPASDGDNVFSRANRWMLSTAVADASPDSLYAILVWDEKPSGDGPGGTAHFERELRRVGGHVRIINPPNL